MLPDRVAAPAERWRRIWQSKDGIWYGLSESEFKQFALEQLARHWAAEEAATA